MRKLLTALVLLACLAPAARAFTLTPTYHFVVPSTGTTGWGLKLNADLVNIDTAIAAGFWAVGSSTGTLLAVKASTGTCGAGFAAQVLGSGSVTCVAVASEVSTNTITGVLPLEKGGLANAIGKAQSVVSGGVDFSTLTAYAQAVSSAASAAAAGVFTSSVTALLFSTTGGSVLNSSLTTSSGTFIASGNTQYSIVTSSGINILAGTLNLGTGALCFGANGCQTAPPGNGTIGGSGTAGNIPYLSAATTLANSPLVRDSATSMTMVTGSSLTAPSLSVGGTATAAAFSGPLTGDVTGNCSGTAGGAPPTGTAGGVLSGSYPNPSGFVLASNRMTIGSQSTTSPAFAYVSGASLSITAHGFYVCAEVEGGYTTNAVSTPAVGFALNGALYDGQTAIIGFGGGTNAGTSAINPLWKHCSATTYTGSVTIVPIWKTNSGTIYTNQYGVVSSYFHVWEMW